MSEQPIAEAMLTSEKASAAPWSEIDGLLSKDSNYWLATTKPDGRPHIVPVGAAWFEGAVYFTSGQGTRKRANLEQTSHAAISTHVEPYDVVIEGEVTMVQDEEMLQRLAHLYSERGWPVTVKDGRFDAPFSAPTTGPAPYDVFKITPSTIFALGTTDETVDKCTRYRF